MNLPVIGKDALMHAKLCFVFVFFCFCFCFVCVCYDNQFNIDDDDVAKMWCREGQLWNVCEWVSGWVCKRVILVCECV